MHNDDECCKHQNNFRCRIDVSAISPQVVALLLRLFTLSLPHWVEKWVLSCRWFSSVDWWWMGFDSISAPILLFFLCISCTCSLCVLYVQTSERPKSTAFWLTIEWEARLSITRWKKNTERERRERKEVETWRNKYFLTTHHCHHSSQHVCSFELSRALVTQDVVSKLCALHSEPSCAPYKSFGMGNPEDERKRVENIFTLQAGKECGAELRMRSIPFRCKHKLFHGNEWNWKLKARSCTRYTCWSCVVANEISRPSTISTSSVLITAIPHKTHHIPLDRVVNISSSPCSVHHAVGLENKNFIYSRAGHKWRKENSPYPSVFDRDFGL